VEYHEPLTVAVVYRSQTMHQIKVIASASLLSSSMKIKIVTATSHW